MPKISKKIVGVVCLVVMLLIVAMVCIRTGVFNHKTGSLHTTKLVLGNGPSDTYMLEKVTTSADQARGLSGRSGLADHTGMLFVYADVNQRCLWMKDMRFNIDMVWLDANDRISSIVSNLSPATYPQTYCANAKYVVELPAGTAAHQGLRVGQIVKL